LKTGVVLNLTVEGYVRRRDFIKGIAGSTVVWPLAARAQQSAMPVIGFLRSTSAAGSEHLVAAFEQGLKEAGFVEGQNVAIDYRWGNDQSDRLSGLAADLIRRQAAVIIGNILATRAIMAATTTIPIVFVGGGDPDSASSPASTIRAATSQAWSFPLLIWSPSGWGCCTTWFPSQSPSPRCFIRTRREPTSIWRRWRRPVKRLAGKS
jgi:hypothetical protein